MPAESEPADDASNPDETTEGGVEDVLAVDDTEAAEPVEAVEDTEAAADAATVDAPAKRGRRISGSRVLAHWVLPVLALLLALAAGYFKWVAGSAHESHTAAEESVRAASESTIAILSYRSDTVDQELAAATDRLTGGFREQYKQLVGDVVAPGAKQQHIAAVAKVPAAASVSATQDHAVVLVFVDQTTTIGNDAPTQTTSSVRVTVDKVRGRWLISQFDPV
jgi:Mce-associated membrane protein